MTCLLPHGGSMSRPPSTPGQMPELKIALCRACLAEIDAEMIAAREAAALERARTHAPARFSCETAEIRKQAEKMSRRIAPPPLPRVRRSEPVPFPFPHPRFAREAPMARPAAVSLRSRARQRRSGADGPAPGSFRPHPRGTAPARGQQPSRRG
jgi:hypothetical protein